jgi:hypothetical protein
MILHAQGTVLYTDNERNLALFEAGGWRGWVPLEYIYEELAWTRKSEYDRTDRN